MAKKVMTYTEALSEVEQILERIQREQTTIDNLAEEVKRATELIASCKAQLLKTEEEIGKAFEN